MTKRLSRRTKAAQLDIGRAVPAAPEVRESRDVTGTVEYLLRVEGADLSADKRFHTETLGTRPQVVALTTYVVMGSAKDLRA